MNKFEVAERVLTWFRDNRIPPEVAADALVLCVAAIIKMNGGDPDEGAAVAGRAIAETLAQGE
jgi:hypothetical protein